MNSGKKERVLSGMRPSGKLHLGHLHGALDNWKRLQEEFDCFYFVADWHALTSEYENTKIIYQSINDMVIDWLSIGIDPRKCTIFIQSKVPEHAELHLLLSMITPLAWLERNPTYKEQLQEIAGRDLKTYGFLGYPVLQASDIIIYKANKVPVGVDQVPHVELTREIARRFNYLYKEVFPVPAPLLAEVPKLLGIDGRKMSKSYDNSIHLSDPPSAIKDKVSQMFTDPKRARKSDPGNPDVCNVFSFHKIYSEESQVEDIKRECIGAKIGCVNCKMMFAESLVKALAPIRSRREYYLTRLDDVEGIIREGNKRARSIAQSTMIEVREAMRL